MTIASTTVEQSLTRLAKQLPTSWPTIATTTLELTDNELDTIRQHPHASVLLEGNRLRLMGIVNTIFADLDTATETHLAEETRKIHDIYATTD